MIMPGVRIGRNAVIRRAVIDNTPTSDGAQIGVDLERDRERFTVAGGVVVIAQGCDRRIVTTSRG